MIDSPAGPRPLTLADVVEAVSDAVPDRPAVVTTTRSYTYREMDERSTRLANHLRSRGVGPGDHVAVHATNRIEWVDALYGCLKARAVPINVNYRYTHDELAHVYVDSGCVAAIVAPEFRPAVDALGLPGLHTVLELGEPYERALASADTTRITGRSPDDHYVVYTGGTTGRPKGVVWRVEDLLRGALNGGRLGAPMESVEQIAAEAAATETPMVMLACGPLMHGGSQWTLANGHVAGSTVALYDRPRFDPREVLDLVERARVVSLTVLGDAMGRPLAEAVLAEPERWDLGCLAAVSTGAAPLSAAVREQLRRALPGRPVLDVFGASESGSAATGFDDGSPGGPTAPNFAGNPQLEVFDEDLAPCPAGVRGRLARSGPIPLGYHGDPERTAATFPVVDGVRWALPGDIARREPDGSVTVLGRGSLCINTGGEKVFPEEVEAVLVGHPGVLDAAVVGVAHDRWGEQVTALVRRRPGAEVSDEELRGHVRTRISDYKVPKSVVFVDRVPRTPAGKLDHRECVRLASAAAEG